ncbi:hypothetical protein FB451DRAFT_1561308 [Mycena latifolia]|nr:hypothetical protein FB451DRAFT_1561308 [Mycena latifolia]
MGGEFAAYAPSLSGLWHADVRRDTLHRARAAGGRGVLWDAVCRRVFLCFCFLGGGALRCLRCGTLCLSRARRWKRTRQGVCHQMFNPPL